MYVNLTDVQGPRDAHLHYNLSRRPFQGLRGKVGEELAEELKIVAYLDPLLDQLPYWLCGKGIQLLRGEVVPRCLAIYP